MPRKLIWGLAVCFAQLATLPGCLHFPYFRTTPEDGPKKIYDRDQANLSQGTDHKTTGPDDKNLFIEAAREKETKSASQMPVGPLLEKGLRLIPPAGPKADAKGLPILDLPKPDEGKSAIVTPEPTQEPMDVRPAGLATAQAPPAVEKKREDALLRSFKAMLDKRHDDAIQYLREFDNDTQEFLLRLFPLIAMVAQKPINELSAAEVAVIYNQLLSAQSSLRARCELAVSKMCFCKDVQGFALYKPLPSNHAFVAGSTDRLGEEVYLYVELKNLMSEKTKDGDYLTRLACTLELYDASDKKVWSHRADRSEAPHRRRAPMHDFYRSYIFYVPPIPPGTYRLTMQIADETTPAQRRVVRESLAFRVTPATN